MEKSLETSTLPSASISHGDSINGLKAETNVTGTIFPVDTVPMCEAAEGLITSRQNEINPVETEYQMDIPLCLGSPRALGKQSEQNTIGSSGELCQTSFSPPASTAFELNLPLTAVGATIDRSPVAPGVALFQVCKVTGTNGADLQQDRESSPLEVLSSNEEFLPLMEHLPSHGNISNISTVIEVDLSCQIKNDYNYEKGKMSEILNTSLINDSTSNNCCGILNNVSTTDGIQESDIPLEISINASNLQSVYGISLHQRETASSKDLDFSINKEKCNRGHTNESIDDGKKSRLLMDRSVLSDGVTLQPSLMSVASAASNNIVTQNTTKGILTYANVVAPPNVREIPTTGYTKECAVIMERLHATSLDAYIEAIWGTMRQKAITYIGQAPDDPTSVLAFVKNQELADLLIREGIWIGWKWIKVSALQQRATKIVISGALPFITDISIAQQLSSYGRLAYPQFRRIPAATRAVSHKGILSFRREAFIILHEHKQVPERITLLEDGKLYTLEVSSEGPKCYRCGQRGHLAISCEKFGGRVELSQPIRPHLRQQQCDKLLQPSVSSTATRPITSEEDEESGAWTEVKSRKRKIQRTELNSVFPNKASKEEKVVSHVVGTLKHDVVSHMGSKLPATKRNPFIDYLATNNNTLPDMLARYPSKETVRHDGNSIRVTKVVSTSDNLDKGDDFDKIRDSLNNKRKESTSQPTLKVVTDRIDALQSRKIFSPEFKRGVSEENFEEIPLNLETSKSEIKLRVHNKDSTGSLVLQPQLNGDFQQTQVLKKASSKKNTFDNYQAKRSERQEKKSGMEKTCFSVKVTELLNDYTMNCGDLGIENKSTDLIPKEVQKLKGLKKLDLPLREDGRKMEKLIDKVDLNPGPDKNNKTRFLIEQLISESKSLRVSKRKELVSKYAVKIPNLKNILEMMMKQGDDPCCLKGSSSYKRLVMIIDDLMDIDRTPKTRAENRKPLKGEEFVSVINSMREVDVEAYWKKHPPDGSNEMDFMEMEQHLEQDHNIYGGAAVSLPDMSHTTDLSLTLEKMTSHDRLNTGLEMKDNQLDNSYLTSESKIGDQKISESSWNTQ